MSDLNESTNLTTVSIPRPLADKIKKRCEGTGFNSVSSYVTYVLRQILSNTEMQEEKVEEPFTEQDEQKVKARLKSLGYLD